MYPSVITREPAKVRRCEHCQKQHLPSQGLYERCSAPDSAHQSGCCHCYDIEVPETDDAKPENACITQSAGQLPVLVSPPSQHVHPSFCDGPTLFIDADGQAKLRNADGSVLLIDTSRPVLIDGPPAIEVLHDCDGCTELRHEVAELRRLVDELRSDQPVIR